MKTITEWIERYKTVPVPVKASVWFVIVGVLQKGIQFLVTPIYTRVLTVEEYGYYSIYGTWSAFLMIFATLNLSSDVFNNGMLKYENDRKRFMSSMQGLGNVVTLVVFLVVLLYCDTFSQLMELEPVILIGLFWQFLFSPAFSLWSQNQKYLFKYKAVLIVTLVTTLAIPMVSLLLIYLLPERKSALVFGNIFVQTIVGLVFYIDNLIQGKVLCKLEYWKFALKFNVPLIPHYLSSVILGQADRIMISHYCGQGKAGIYSLSYTLSLTLTVVVNAIAATYAPWTYRQMEEKNYRKINTISKDILLVLGAMTFCGVLIAPEIILILGTEEYLEAKWIIAPVMLGCYFTMVYSLFAYIEFYFEKSIPVMLASVVSAISNIILNMFFIPKYGFIAAGYTTLICCVLQTVLHYLSMRKICREKGVFGMYNMKFLVTFSVVLTACSLLLMLTYNYIYVRYGLAFGGIVLVFIFRKKIMKIILDKMKIYRV